METKKRKYVKPKLTVAEWDFNEAVCQDAIAHCSKTMCIDVNQGQWDAHYTEFVDEESSITWQNWRPSSSNR